MTEWDGDDILEAGTEHQVLIGADSAHMRIDKALADASPDLSRARVQALIASGAVQRDGRLVDDPSSKAAPGTYVITRPPLLAAIPEPQNIPLSVLYEDDHIIVVDKPAGMAAHPAPGTPDATLVNALLFHCGRALSGIGGVLRPGIVHRLDKGTSGIMVVAKSEVAHTGLAALFERHDIDRQYIALTRGAPQPAAGSVESQIGRSPHDRKKMAILKQGGRQAITHFRTRRRYGPSLKPIAARVECTLETGRTHQIRVHLASLGTPCLGDPVYGSGRPAAAVVQAITAVGLERQALHAARLGFVHPLTGAKLAFETELPDDMRRLEAALAKEDEPSR